MVLRRALVIWLLIIAAEFIHGILRELLLVPIVGDFRARQISVFTGSLMILIISCLFVRWLRADSLRALIGIGLLWLALTLLFELGFGRLILQLSWQRLLSDYDMRRGGLLPFGLLWLTLSPLLAAKLRGIKVESQRAADRLSE
jgi:hypothetical protein